MPRKLKRLKSKQIKFIKKDTDMPVMTRELIDGPNVQSDGSVRGTIKFIFDDGREKTRTVRAEDETAWSNLMIKLESDVEEAQQLEDAEAAAERDEDIEETEAKEASREQIAFAFLRSAYQLEDPYQAYLKFSRFNDYRKRKGWSLSQVVAGLTSVGLTAEEWDLMRTRYQYLANPARVTAMEAYQGILANDPLFN